MLTVIDSYYIVNFYGLFMASYQHFQLTWPVQCQTPSTKRIVFDIFPKQSLTLNVALNTFNWSYNKDIYISL